MNLIEIPTNDGLMSAVYLRAAENVAERIPIILLHEGFGLNTHIEALGKRLAERGHAVVAPNLFYRQSREGAQYDDVPRALKLCANAQAKELVADISSAARFLQSGGDRVTAVGFCFGGAAAYIAAALCPEVQSAVAYYPVSILNYWNEVGPPSVPLLVHLGDNDEFLGPDEQDWLDSIEADSSIPIECVLYKGAGHAFFNDSRSDLFSADAAAESWKRSLRHIDEFDTGRERRSALEMRTENGLG